MSAMAMQSETMVKRGGAVRRNTRSSMMLVATPPKDRSRTEAAVLALLLGSFGVHRFYLGRVGTGLLSVYFCWTLIPTVVGIVEGIKMLTMSDEDFAQRYS